MSESDWILFFLIVLIFGGAILFYRLYQFYRCKNIFKKIQWIATKSTEQPKYSNCCYGCNNLIYYLADETCNLKIPKEYQITFSYNEETLVVEEILEMFKSLKIDGFFKEDRTSLSQKDKFYYELNSLEYHMLSLYCFLGDIEDLDEVHRNLRDKVYENEREYTDNSHYNLNLTDFGVAYYKLLLITRMFCEKNEKIKNRLGSMNSDCIMKHLDTKKVGYWTYRP